MGIISIFWNKKMSTGNILGPCKIIVSDATPRSFQEAKSPFTLKFLFEGVF